MSRPAFSTSWREGRFFDAWMLVHFASGIAGGFSNVFFSLAALKVFAIGFGLMVLWEVLEALAGVREALSNRVMDVVVGLAGVGVALGIAPRLSVGAERAAFVVTIGAGLVGMAFGVRARRRRVKAGIAK